MAANKPMSAMPAATDKRGTGMDRTAVKRRATAMPATTESAMSAMSAANFDHGIVGCGFFRDCGTGIDQGECFGALAGHCR
jgi:hypothetical protein